MSVLFGHPVGNPNSYHAAFAYLENGSLEAFCVPWLPSKNILRVLNEIPPIRSMARRLTRRQFSPLEKAPMVQGRMGEFSRLFRRALGWNDRNSLFEASHWLMRTMRRECRRPMVTSVHSYEDSSLWQFETAKGLGKACLYDMPSGCYPAWEKMQDGLMQKYSDWLPAGGLPSNRHVYPEQKRRELELADLILAPSSFVEQTVHEFHPNKKVARAAYGVDLEFWRPAIYRHESLQLRFVYAGNVSLRKGIPLLLTAWESAGLKNAELEIIGSWQLAGNKRLRLPRGVRGQAPCSPEELRGRLQAADVFVHPSYFEGLSLGLLEAMACGLPAIASVTAGADILDSTSGRLVPTGDLDALIDVLRWFNSHREELTEMSLAARSRAEKFTWEKYRSDLIQAVAPYA